MSCPTRLGIVHAPYPGRGNSYSSSSRERRGRGRVSGITIRIVPTGQYIFHCTRHTITILKATSSSQTVVTNSRYTIMSSVYQVISTNMTPSYKNNQQHHPIVRSCLDSWGNRWARTRTQQQIHQVDWHKETSLTNIPIHYYRFVVHTNTIIYNNQQQQKNKKERGKECY